MRIRWRGLELPSRVIRDDANSTTDYGRFIIEPFEQGFGTTIGNSLRRILISSLEGAAVVNVKIAGVAHEFSTIDGVLEDVTDIILNIKGIDLALDGDEPKTISVRRDTAGAIRARDIEEVEGVRMVNPDHLIATLTADVEFHVEMEVRKGRGYATAMENRAPEQEVDVIPVDSVFSPVRRVRYKTEDLRVGQRTNYDRLILEIWTRGTVLPEDVLVEAGIILRKHLNPIVMYHDMGDGIVTAHAPEPIVETAAMSAPRQGLDQPVSSLNLSVRSANCLEQARIATIGELVAHSEGELLRFRSFGKTSLHEVQRKLSDMGLSLAGSDDSIASPILGAASDPDSEAGLDAPLGTDEAGGDGADSAGTGPMEVFTMEE